MSANPTSMTFPAVNDTKGATHVKLISKIRKKGLELNLSVPFLIKTFWQAHIFGLVKSGHPLSQFLLLQIW